LTSLLARVRAAPASSTAATDDRRSPNSRWTRHELGSGLELHVRADVERKYAAAIADIMRRFETP
jgi:hypothetical protein